MIHHIQKKVDKWLPWLIILIGIGLRLREYIANRSFWVDESYLALNIQNRSFFELLQPLSDSQHAPFGFLWAEKVMVTFFGTSEYIFRLIPLITGILSVIVFFLLIRKICSRNMTFVALALFAFSDLLIRYAVELKQYSTELLVTLFIYVYFWPFLQGKKFTTKGGVSVVIGGVVTLLFSHSAIFTLTSVVLILGIRTLMKGERRGFLQYGIIGVIWVIFFSFLYMHDASNAYSDTFFLSEWPYFQLLPHNLSQIVGNISGFYSFFLELLGPYSRLFGFFFFFIGITIALKKDRIVAVAFVLPSIVALCASGLHKYPFVMRVFLFSVPAWIFFITHGFFWVAHKCTSTKSTYLKIGVYVGFASLFFYSFAFSLYHIAHPREIEEIKPVLAHYQLYRKPGDILYIYYASQGPYAFYARRFGIQNDAHVIGIMSRNDWVQYKKDFNKLKGKKRVWVLFSHMIVGEILPNGQTTNEADYIVDYLDSIGHQQDVLRKTGASLYLYNLAIDKNP